MFSCPHVDPDLDILFEKLATQIPFAHYASEVVDFMQSLSSFLRCFVIVAISIGPGGAKNRGRFKGHQFEGQPIKEGVDPFRHTMK